MHKYSYSLCNRIMLYGYLKLFNILSNFHQQIIVILQKFFKRSNSFIFIFFFQCGEHEHNLWTINQVALLLVTYRTRAELISFYYPSHFFFRFTVLLIK
uniref:Uncharacterized protein n=1 Tax=Ascaris lumbricoides TaxID=6252 RepID=A0A0M3HH61_ASCLU